jgi:hypothetical protein
MTEQKEKVEQTIQNLVEELEEIGVYGKYLSPEEEKNMTYRSFWFGWIIGQITEEEINKKLLQIREALGKI